MTMPITGQGMFTTSRAQRFPGTVSLMPEMRLHDPAGNRLQLDAEEQSAFLAAARRPAARDRTLCETLHHTGCRPSEIVEIAPSHMDLSGRTVTIRSLKDHCDASGCLMIFYRSVSVPPDDLGTLATAHDLRQAQRSRKRAAAPI